MGFSSFAAEPLNRCEAFHCSLSELYYWDGDALQGQKVDFFVGKSDGKGVKGVKGVKAAFGRSFWLSLVFSA